METKNITEELNSIKKLISIIDAKNKEIALLKLEIGRLKSKSTFHHEYSPMQILLAELPLEFSRKDFIECTLQLKYPLKTCEKWLKKLIDEGYIIHVMHNHYVKKNNIIKE